MPYGILAADQIQSSVTGVSLGAGNATQFKNRLINGNMVIDQRNSGASLTPTNGAYTLDRWSANLTQASKFTVQQNAGSVTPPTGFTKYLGVTSSSAYSVSTGDYFAILQAIEGNNVADLGFGTASAKTVTLSAWVYSSLTGTFGGALRNYNADRSYPFNYSIPVANTWTQISVTIPGDTTGTWSLGTNTGSMFVIFSLGAGSTLSTTANAWAAGNYIQPTGSTSVVGTSGATLYITGVQLEVGSFATGYDFVDYTSQLNMCYRYYWRVTPGAATLYYPSVYSPYAGNSMFGTISIPIPMRTAPTFTYSALSDWNTTSPVYNGGNNTSWTMNGSGVQQANLTIVSTNSGFTTQAVVFPYPNNSTAWFAFSAEL